MLRITVHDNPELVTFQLEGGLAGSWVGEVETCRQRTLAGRRQPVVRFDLAGATFIDDAGKAYLAAMHRLGAQFIAADCLTKAIVAEITNGQKSEVGGRKSEEDHQLTEVGGRKSEEDRRKSEVRNQKSEEDHQRTEVRSQKSEVTSDFRPLASDL